MTKAEFVKKVQEKCNISVAMAHEVVDAWIEIMREELITGHDVQLGIGKFSVVSRKARTGRNPRTGEATEIPARKVVRFQPFASLKDALK